MGKSLNKIILLPEDFGRFGGGSKMRSTAGS
jgi:hypothetical protein